MQLALVKGIMPVARLTDLSMAEKKGLDKLLAHVKYELNAEEATYETRYRERLCLVVLAADSLY